MRGAQTRGEVCAEGRLTRRREEPSAFRPTYFLGTDDERVTFDDEYVVTFRVLSFLFSATFGARLVRDGRRRRAGGFAVRVVQLLSLRIQSCGREERRGEKEKPR